MMKINLLAEGLCGASPRKQPRELRDEGFSTIPTSKAPAMDDQFRRLTKAIQMASPSAIAALAAEAAASAARAAHNGAHMGPEVDLKLILALAMEHPIAFNSDSVIHRGHDGGSPRLMSPFFDQEPKFACFNSMRGVSPKTGRHIFAAARILKYVANRVNEVLEQGPRSKARGPLRARRRRGIKSGFLSLCRE